MKKLPGAILLAGMSCVVSAGNFDTSRAVVEKLQQLNSLPCGFDCQIEIASLYSDELLATRRKATLFGKRFPLAQLDAMSASPKHFEQSSTARIRGEKAWRVKY